MADNRPGEAPVDDISLLYQAFFAKVQEPVLILRLATVNGSVTAVICDCNDAVHSLSNQPPPVAGTTVAEDYLPEIFDNALLDICRQVVLSERVLYFGARAGQAFYLVRMVPLSQDHLGVMLSDITDRKRTEQALLSLRRLSTTLHATVDVEGILDEAVTGAMRILGAEKALIALCTPDGFSSYHYVPSGKPVGATGGGSVRDQVPARVVFSREPYLSNAPCNDPHIDAGLAAAHRVRNVICTPLADNEGAMIGFLEIQNKKDPGGFTSFDLEQLATVAQIAAQAVKNAQDFQKISQDATELEQRVAERTAQLQEVNDELDAFAFSISHGLRAPLRAILTFAEILQEQRDQEGSRERDAFLERIIAAGEDMDQLILDLLSYSRLSSQAMLLQTVHLDAVLREALEQVQRSGQEGEFLLEGLGNLPKVRGNHAALVQVVWNLFSNAAKYVAPGVAPKVRVWAERANGKVRLFVQDNGIGIAPENQERIFEVFERLHGVETYPGTGIGLAIARKAVAKLGGEIAVASHPGEGSRFWIELPAADEPPLPTP